MDMTWMVEGLKKPHKKKGLLAQAMGLRASAISELLNGTRRLKFEEAIKGAQYLEVSLSKIGDVKDYLAPPSTDDVGERLVPMLAPVRGRSAAGVWLEYDYADEERYEEIPYVPCRYPSLPQFAYKIMGNSMIDEKIFDGDYAICVEFSVVRAIPMEGDVVIAERRRGGLMERTCKLIDRSENGELILVSRSPDPRYQEPMHLGNGSDDTEVEVMGLVVGTYRPRN